FGGIMKCDIIAQGIVEAAETMGIDIPVVVRLDGTNAEKGREILTNSGLALVPAKTFAEAAKKAVELANSKKED
ncbi:MAG: succinate--CoA ligase subunit beta, partial [Clostridia bacterium]|nr:succinate--CoA ligase subunit beta [Clostridia bacterium]